MASGRYDSPYQMHATFAPNCALADVKADSAVVSCGSQAIYATRARLAELLRLPLERVTVRYVESSGTFGRSCYDDAAQAAAVMSQEVGAPVRVQFMRWDEHGWEPYQAAHSGDVKVACDASGKIVAYEYHGWQHGHAQVEPTLQLAAGRSAVESEGIRASGAQPFDAGDMYVIPNWRIVTHRVPGLSGYLRSAQLRSPFDIAVSFASEQVVDDLAYAAGADPYQFRRQNINGERWLSVLDAVAKAANWTPRRAATNIGKGRIRTGRGIALGTHLSSYGAAVAEIDVDTQTGVVVAKHMYGAIDAGQAINPGIIEHQIEGQMCQAVSRMLKEEVTFSTSNVTSLDWASYPMLRFGEAPEVTAIVVKRQDMPASGAGEEALAAGAVAIANAFFDATGVRIHKCPLTPARVQAALRTA
jgi:nicotinate dehydrogenase subunit B